MTKRDDFHKIQMAVNDYAEWEKGLDPIGASDMLTDWMQFITMQVASGEYETPEKSWVTFNERIIKPLYGIDLP